MGRTRLIAAVAVAVVAAFGAGVVVGEEVAYTTDDQDWSGFRPDTPTAPGVTNVTTLIDRSDGEHARCWATMESEGCTYWYP